MTITPESNFVQIEREQVNTIDEKCEYCDHNLSIQKSISLAVEAERTQSTRGFPRKIGHKHILDSDHEGFYVSPGGFYYCSKYCFHMFTEN